MVVLNGCLTELSDNNLAGELGEERSLKGNSCMRY